VEAAEEASRIELTIFLLVTRARLPERVGAIEKDLGIDKKIAA
jgi:hypothetical protein